VSAEVEIRAIYTKYRNGDGITDTELATLLAAIGDALPFLAAAPAFSLVYREACTDREALEGFRRARGRKTIGEVVELPPVQFMAILKRHIGVEPTKYRHHAGTETPHLFTFPLQGRGYAGQATSFSINFADMQILMEQHGLLRMQSNDPGEITLYFSEMAK
jgi:hypothetical protein